MKPRATLTTALLLLAIPLVAVAAPTYRERYKCYEPCRERCMDRYSCENRNATLDCFTNFNKCKSVYPSGSASDPARAATLPPAPGRLTTNICCPQDWLNRSVTNRKATSGVLPADESAMICTGLFG